MVSLSQAHNLGILGPQSGTQGPQSGTQGPQSGNPGPQSGNPGQKLFSQNKNKSHLPCQYTHSLNLSPTYFGRGPLFNFTFQRF